MKISIIIVALFLAETCSATGWSTTGGNLQNGGSLFIYPAEDPKDDNVDFYDILYYKDRKKSDSPIIYKRQKCVGSTKNETEQMFSCSMEGKSPLAGVTYSVSGHDFNKADGLQGECSATYSCIENCHLNENTPMTMCEEWYEGGDQDECFYKMPTKYALNTTMVNLRSGPSIFGKVISKIPPGNKLKTIGHDESCRRYFMEDSSAYGYWVQVVYIENNEELVGWVLSEYLTYLK